MSDNLECVIVFGFYISVTTITICLLVIFSGHEPTAEEVEKRACIEKCGKN